MDLRELRYVVALADETNFTRAAARCHVSQPAFSRAIALLERRLGTPIAERRSRGCSMTPAGSRLARAARAILAETDMLTGLVTDLRGAAEPRTREGGVLRLGLLLDGVGRLTPGLVAAFQEARPATRVVVSRIQPHEIPGALVTGAVDVALLHGPCDDERVELVGLFDESRVVALAGSHDLADADRLSAEDLLTLPARARRPGIDPGWEGFFTLLGERGEQPRRIGEPARSLEELLWSISVDGVFLTVPEHLAATYGGETYGVRYVPVPDLPPVTFSVAARRGDTDADVRAFVALARRVAASS